MKRLLIVAFVIVAQMSCGQVTKNLGDFSDIKVFDKLKVELIPSSENKAEITGNRESEVEFVNKNGELKIRMPFPKLLSGDDITIKLYFRNIESITASEGSFVSCDTRFKQTIMDLSAKEGAQINIDLDVEKVNVKAVTGGIIELSGKALNQDVVIMSGGNLQSKELHTSQTSINVSAGGNAEIHASSLVDAKVKAGGSIYIYGSPKQINKETLFGGTIVEKK
ncbi:Putative auto-transporter adhesin, head GIN domain [Flavobacterium gillisiae]|uniref:Putative auto-transporter adhesin, head GIN domain n=1 Tax=Flavobacterium gillisiae TaxID=150146 RepID=A0A1H3Z8F2_9FLAO|nr:head GIN domain-containing protein [Flavobacterium gillisiae]SEA19661.1 Putative auto-transporter adhesin, head GIN domain [Flavobacterium gillisiae]